MLADDPVLTVRDCYRERPLARVIFDRRLRTPATARVFSTLDAGPIIIVTTAAAVGRKPEQRSAHSRRPAPRSSKAPATWAADVRRLLSWDISTLLLEGGGAIHAAAWRPASSIACT